eukprot:1191283-Prymnesium_polylepis.1
MSSRSFPGEAREGRWPRRYRCPHRTFSGHRRSNDLAAIRGACQSGGRWPSRSGVRRGLLVACARFRSQSTRRPPSGQTGSQAHGLSSWAR